MRSCFDGLLFPLRSTDSPTYSHSIVLSHGNALRLGGVLCSLEYIACGRRSRYMLRTLDPEVHPSCFHGLKYFFGRSGVALRELLHAFFSRS